MGTTATPRLFTRTGVSKNLMNKTSLGTSFKGVMGCGWWSLGTILVRRVVGGNRLIEGVSVLPNANDTSDDGESDGSSQVTFFLSFRGRLDMS